MDITHAWAAQGLNSVAVSSLALDNAGEIVTKGAGADGILAHNTHIRLVPRRRKRCRYDRRQPCRDHDLEGGCRRVFGYSWLMSTV